MSHSILCNYFKVCTKFTLEGAGVCVGGGGGGGYHKQSEGLGGVSCHIPSYVTTSRCARSLRLKELSE